MQHSVPLPYMHAVQKHVANTHTPSSLCSPGILLSLFTLPSCSLLLFFYQSLFLPLPHFCYCSTPLHLNISVICTHSFKSNGSAAAGLVMSPCHGIDPFILHDQLKGEMSSDLGHGLCFDPSIYHLVEDSLCVCV